MNAAVRKCDAASAAPLLYRMIKITTRYSTGHHTFTPSYGAIQYFLTATLYKKITCLWFVTTKAYPSQTPLLAADAASRENIKGHAEEL